MVATPFYQAVRKRLNNYTRGINPDHVEEVVSVTLPDPEAVRKI
jgi:hypothetical protein